MSELEEYKQAYDYWEKECIAARAEIERLEAALQEIKDQCGEGDPVWHVANDALEPKP